jgi:hypothetical protein
MNSLNACIVRVSRGRLHHIESDPLRVRASALVLSTPYAVCFARFGCSSGGRARCATWPLSAYHRHLLTLRVATKQHSENNPESTPCNPSRGADNDYSASGALAYRTHSPRCLGAGWSDAHQPNRSLSALAFQRKARKTGSINRFQAVESATVICRRRRIGTTMAASPEMMRSTSRAHSASALRFSSAYS